MPVRSIHAIGSRGMGGAERFFARLIRALCRDGFESLAVIRRGAELEQALDPAVRRVPTGMRNGLDVLTWHRIRALIREHRPEIVQTYLGRASRLTRVPRGSDTLHVARLGGYYRPHSYRHAHAWVGVTRGICDHLARLGFPAERIFHIPNFVELPPPPDPALGRGARERLGVPPEAWLVSALGRLVPKKGFAELLHAFARVPREVAGRPVHLVIAGDGPENGELQRLATRLGLAARVRWAGWLADPAPLFAAADVFVCPSREEAMGNVLLEAWAHRVPLISTRTPGATELVTHGETGLLVEIGDVAGLALELRRALEMDEPERRAMAEAGERLVRGRHDEATVVRSYRELYRRLREAR